MFLHKFAYCDKCKIETDKDKYINGKNGIFNANKPYIFIKNTLSYIYI